MPSMGMLLDRCRRLHFGAEQLRALVVVISPDG